MTKKKETLLDKIVKRDYNNDLEEVLSTKTYQEEVKNLLLDIMYKIENSYKDYETVKKNVISKQEYVQNVINTVKNCENIEFIKPNKDEKRTFEVDVESKKIKCYPIGRKLLYCISKIQKCENIIKDEPEILEKCLTNMINVGNNINTVEPLRDFNGFSWNISVLDIENFYYNIIYQDLIIICGNRIIDEWTNKHDEMIDYQDLLKEDLENKYGKKFLRELCEILKTLSILLELQTNKSFKDEMALRKQYVEEELKKMENRVTYLEELSERKKDLTNQIGKIDIILNDKEKLTEEYKNRNKDLPLEQKIFSKRILKINLEKERNLLMNELKESTYKMNSKNFLQNQKSLEYELKYLNLLSVEDQEKEILRSIIVLQKKTLQAIKQKIEKTKDKEELIKIWHEIRYFNLIPLDTVRNMEQIPKLAKSLKEVKDKAINKAYELKVINEICKNKDLNLKILEYVFSLHIISLEDIYAKIVIEKDGIYIQFYDENIADEKFNLDFDWKKEGLKIKLNKKIKVLEG